MMVRTGQLHGLLISVLPSYRQALAGSIEVNFVYNSETFMAVCQRIVGIIKLHGDDLCGLLHLIGKP